jgi:hypothetical protein
LLLLVASACRLDVEVDIDVEDDGSGTVTVTASADAELLAQVPDAVDQLRVDDARAAGWAVEGPTTSEDGGAAIRLTKPFRTPEEATAILTELNGPAGPLHALVLTQSREFARVTTTFTGTARLDGGVAAFADQALIELAGGPPFEPDAGPDPGASIGLTVRLRAPGSVIETTGAVDGSTVTWQPSLAAGASTELRAVFEERDRMAERARSWQRFTSTAIWVWLLIVALIALGVTILLLRRQPR